MLQAGFGHELLYFCLAAQACVDGARNAVPVRVEFYSKGYDPDNSTRLGSNNWGANRQFFSYPRPKTFSFGVNVTF